MRSDKPIYRRNADGCHRCRRLWADGETRYLVRATVPYMVFCAQNVCAVSMPEVVSVCVGCLEPAECATGETWACGGCRASIRATATVPRRVTYVWRDHGYCKRQERVERTCSSRCAQRVARARRRASRPLEPCVVCGQPFQPTRADARTCRPACRQRAYRQRRAQPEPCEVVA